MSNDSNQLGQKIGINQPIALSQSVIDYEAVDPIFYSLIISEERQAFELLKTSGRLFEIIDPIEEMIEDLFRINFPFVETKTSEYQKSLVRFRDQYLGGRSVAEVGRWVYFPWRQTVIHILDQADHYRLRTSRNHFLITPEEQRILATKTIGIAGLSVGSTALQNLLLSGIGHSYRLADYDTLSLTNFNRLYSSLVDLGRNKAVALARRIREIDPYQSLDLFPAGFTEETMVQFLTLNNQPLDLMIEAMDSIKLKVTARFEARKRRIPVIMSSDDGDNAIVDVERFDLEPDRPVFHGRIPESVLASIPDRPSISQKANLAVQIVGTDITPRMQFSLTMVGAQIPTWPQLATGANAAGIASAYAARRILNGEPMPSGRYQVNINQLLDPTYSAPETVAARQQQKADFCQAFELLFGEEEAL